MASVTSNWISPSVGTSAFNATLTTQERLHHFISPSNPSEGLRPRYLSEYIHDSLQNEVERANHRQGYFPGVPATVLTNLKEMLQDCNSLDQIFLSLRAITQGDEASQTIRLVIHANQRPPNEHERRYNAPVASEVADIVIGSHADHIHRSDTVLRERGVLNLKVNGAQRRISASHTKYDALCYPLLFSDRRDGWHIGLQCAKPGSNNQKKVSPMMFYQPFLFKHKIISLLFMVDMYV